MRRTRRATWRDFELAALKGEQLVDGATDDEAGKVEFCPAQHPRHLTGCVEAPGHLPPHRITAAQYGGPSTWWDVPTTREED